MNKEKNKDEIDLIKVMKTLWAGRKLMIRITLIFSVIGLTIGLISPKIYTASSVFVPQISEGGAPSALSGIAASLAGINMNTMGSESDIPAILYPKIFSSVPFRLEILKTEITWSTGTGSYQSYLLGKSNILEQIKKYTIGLPGLILKSNDKGADEEYQTSASELVELSDDDYGAIKSLEDVMSININEQRGFITLLIEDEDPRVAAQVTIAAQEALQQHVINYKIKKAQDLYEFAEEQRKQKQGEFYLLQDSLAEFNEKNQGISSAFLENKRRRLQARYDMANALYTELSKQKEEAALKVKKDTPIFSVIDPATVPKRRTSPKRMLLLVIYTSIGFFVSLGFILAREPIRKIKNLLIEKDP